MTFKSIARVTFNVLVTALSCVPLASGADHENDGAPIDFARDVQPIFARACLKCHGPDRQRGKLRLDERASAFAGGDSGEPAVRPGDVGASPLLERVTTPDAERRMPLKGEPLSADEIALLKRWVAQGAPLAGGTRKLRTSPARAPGHRRGPGALGVPPAPGGRASGSSPVRSGSHGHRLVFAREAGAERPGVFGRGRAAHADPALGF